mmetsp:Transcript_40068/g.101798  ORF Transcript_40068/g.101798 Transcript_40068/m.101798 type:complete len:120 (+) Transcript_40068:225-584(+)
MQNPCSPHIRGGRSPPFTARCASESSGGGGIFRSVGATPQGAMLGIEREPLKDRSADNDLAGALEWLDSLECGSGLQLGVGSQSLLPDLRAAVDRLEDDEGRGSVPPDCHLSTTRWVGS